MQPTAFVYHVVLLVWRGWPLGQTLLKASALVAKCTHHWCLKIGTFPGVIPPRLSLPLPGPALPRCSLRLRIRDYRPKQDRVLPAVGDANRYLYVCVHPRYVGEQ